MSITGAFPASPGSVMGIAVVAASPVSGRRLVLPSDETQSVRPEQTEAHGGKLRNPRKVKYENKRNLELESFRVWMAFTALAIACSRDSVVLPTPTPIQG